MSMVYRASHSAPTPDVVGWCAALAMLLGVVVIFVLLLWVCRSDDRRRQRETAQRNSVKGHAPKPLA